MKQKLSQEKKILRYLLRHKQGLTPLQALDKFGCFRLASRCCDLRKQGYSIQCEMVSKNGKRYARYYFENIFNQA